ncbi:MAG TPA: anti-sigma factor [Thermoanaerobaculia bacterium]|nr:anti-sigma factor [Thermoanaerobaculia bacterium]
MSQDFNPESSPLSSALPSLSADDQAILTMLAVLERPPGQGDEVLPRPSGDESIETLTRLYAEVLGLLPSAELPARPAPQVKSRLLALVTGDETLDASAEALAPPPPYFLDAEADTPEIAGTADIAADQPPSPRPALESTAVSPPVPIYRPEPGVYEPSISEIAEITESRHLPTPPQVRRPAAAPAAAPVPVAQAPAPSPGTGQRPAAAAPLATRRRSRWPLALAAVLILGLVGLSSYLTYGLWQQSERIAELTRERNELIDRAKAANSNLAQARNDLNDMRARMTFMTSPGVEISPLRLTGQVPMPEGTYGMLFVAADHQHWHLAVHGLVPSGSGRLYCLWFISPQGAVNGGTFTAAPGAPVDLSSEHMPAGTQAVTVTLEPAPGGAAPSGPEVLRAAPPVKLL